LIAVGIPNLLIHNDPNSFTHKDNPLSHRPRKRFGQNFLHDPGVIARIVQAIDPQPGQQIVEIGPGLGALTLPLLQRCGRLHAIELDRDLIPGLQQMAQGMGELLLHQADALRFDYCQLDQHDGGLRLAGNLPYNISTPLLFHLLDQARCIRDMHFMLQKEVVERMAAEPGGKDYGRLSVMLQVRCRVLPLFDIGPGAFRPAPKVDSSVVRLLPYSDPSPFRINDPDGFARIVAAAFAQRRKTLRNALRKELDAALLEQAGIRPDERAEQLAPADFVRLANLACKPAY